MLARTYGTITKQDLLLKANRVAERFNNANFKAKSWLKWLSMARLFILS